MPAPQLSVPFRTRGSARFECWADLHDESKGPLVEQAVALVTSLHAVGRYAFYETQRDGHVHVFAAYPGSIAEGSQTIAARRWLDRHSEITFELEGAGRPTAGWRVIREGIPGIGLYADRGAATIHTIAEVTGLFRGLPLTIDEVIARYLWHIADGPGCVDHLTSQGFDAWLDAWRDCHARQNAAGIKCEWDSHDYTDHEMRMIFDGILAHAGRKARA